MKRLLVTVALFTSLAALAGGKGQGGIVIHNDSPVYDSSDGPKTNFHLKRGWSVVGVTLGFMKASFSFDHKNGRVRVAFFVNEEQKGINKSGWMNPADLATFYYDGGCNETASPYDSKGFSLRWNSCYQEGRDAKLEFLQKEWAAQSAPTSAPLPAPVPASAPASAPSSTPGK